MSWGALSKADDNLVWNMGMVLTYARTLFQRNEIRCVRPYTAPAMVFSNNDTALSALGRICVALSRAKRGLYIVANFNDLARKSKTWKKICEALQDGGNMAEYEENTDN